MPRDTAYLEIADALRKRILAAEWPVGARLPSRARFAEEYAVGQYVAQRAMELLIIEGFLEGRAGSGTYIRVPRKRMRIPRSRLRRLSGPGGRDNGGGTWQARSKARTPAPERIAGRLAISTGDPCVHTSYAFLAEGRPVETCESWEPMAVTDRTPVVLPESGPLKGAGVIERMRSIGVTVVSATEIPRPARATQTQANLLNISVGDLITEIERTHYASDGRPVETADIVIADRRAEVAYEITYA
ncbi:MULTISPECIES: GntR family transcriptional regulator [unclassified Streptomyces]|uniref:GntR family transcriptional regulator n=1 Tax=unclassified Streptomyces TaxID=2593676 RepID=UPI002258DA27|nr:GntR family transcriptional regulator [Streptomyces sp. NBC_00047]MCX5607261.1 GntR family transcriptional regulator [Streptomyces sp. NBC_00047]